MNAVDEDVSVVIPTRASGRGLGRAVASALTQERVTTRLIVIVDGEPSDSNDRRLLTQLDDPHRVVRVSRIGLPGPLRNLGLDLVRTPRVAFLDDDDWWIPSKLGLQLPILTQQRCAITGSNAVKIVHGKPAGLYFDDMPDDMTLDHLMTTNWLITSSVVVDTAVLKSVGGFPTDQDLRACDDYAGWLKVAAVGGVATTREPLVNYSVAASESVSSADRLSGADSRSRVLRHLMTASKHWKMRLTRRQRALLSRHMLPDL